jgi:hypothetical protein
LRVRELEAGSRDQKQIARREPIALDELVEPTISRGEIPQFVDRVYGHAQAKKCHCSPASFFSVALTTVSRLRSSCHATKWQYATRCRGRLARG